MTLFDSPIADSIRKLTDADLAAQLLDAGVRARIHRGVASQEEIGAFLLLVDEIAYRVEGRPLARPGYARTGDSDEARDAGEAVAANEGKPWVIRSGSARHRALLAFCPVGMDPSRDFTDDEVGDYAGIEVAETARRRVSDLIAHGFVEVVGSRRSTRHTSRPKRCSKITPRGLIALSELRGRDSWPVEL